MKLRNWRFTTNMDHSWLFHFSLLMHGYHHKWVFEGSFDLTHWDPYHNPVASSHSVDRPILWNLLCTEIHMDLHAPRISCGRAAFTVAVIIISTSTNKFSNISWNHTQLYVMKLIKNLCDEGLVFLRKRSYLYPPVTWKLAHTHTVFNTYILYCG